MVPDGQFLVGLCAGEFSGDSGNENFRSLLSEFCPAGWEIVSTKLMVYQEIHRALVVLPG